MNKQRLACIAQIAKIERPGGSAVTIMLLNVLAKYTYEKRGNEWLCNIKKQKLSYEGHLPRGSTGLQILEGKMNSQTAQGRPRRRPMRINDIRSWMSLDSYEEIKNTAQDRSQWRVCVWTPCQPIIASALEDDS